MELAVSQGYRQLLEQISGTYTAGQLRSMQAVNTQLVETYWQVGRHFVEFEQAGKLRAEYGKALIDQLSADLRLRHGKSFNRSNLIYMRIFYLRYPISEMPSHQLSWSHYLELLKRQKASSLFLRLAASKDKAGILQLASQGQVVQQPADFLLEPFSATISSPSFSNWAKASPSSAANTASPSTTPTTASIWSSTTASSAASPTKRTSKAITRPSASSSAATKTNYSSNTPPRAGTASSSCRNTNSTCPTAKL